MIIKEGDFVEILTPTGKDFINDKIGQVENVNGDYILVKRNISGVIVEMYTNELRVLEGNERFIAYFNQNMFHNLKTSQGIDELNDHIVASNQLDVEKMYDEAMKEVIK